MEGRRGSLLVSMEGGVACLRAEVGVVLEVQAEAGAEFERGGRAGCASVAPPGQAELAGRERVLAEVLAEAETMNARQRRMARAIASGARRELARTGPVG